MTSSLGAVSSSFWATTRPNSGAVLSFSLPCYSLVGGIIAGAADSLSDVVWIYFRPIIPWSRCYSDRQKMTDILTYTRFELLELWSRSFGRLSALTHHRLDHLSHPFPHWRRRRRGCRLQRPILIRLVHEHPHIKVLTTGHVKPSNHPRPSLVTKQPPKTIVGVSENRTLCNSSSSEAETRILEYSIRER